MSECVALALCMYGMCRPASVVCDFVIGKYYTRARPISIHYIFLFVYATLPSQDANPTAKMWKRGLSAKMANAPVSE